MQGFLLALLISAGLLGAASMLGLVDIKFNAHPARNALESVQPAGEPDEIQVPGDEASDSGNSRTERADDADTEERPSTLREIRVKDRDER